MRGDLLTIEQPRSALGRVADERGCIEHPYRL